jgi:hypothetical protein
MAIISLIQGTDSLSASRITLNDNFTAINDELGLLTGFLDPNTASLTGIDTAEVITSLTVAAGASATFTSVLNTLASETDVDGMINIKGGITYDSVAIGAGGMPAAFGFSDSTYMVDSATAALPITLNQAEEGQEITIIAVNGAVTVDASSVAGAATISIAQFGTLTLRYVGSSWYVIGSFLSTIA